RRGPPIPRGALGGGALAGDRHRAPLVDRARQERASSPRPAPAAQNLVNPATESQRAHGQLRYIERLYRDARMWIVPDGTAQIQRLVIGRELTGFSAVHG